MKFIFPILYCLCVSVHAANIKEIIAQGEKLYHGPGGCVACHQKNGEGLEGMIPPLKNSDWVKGDKKRLISLCINGLEGAIRVNGKIYKNVMPPQVQFDDEQLAAILTFIRQSWGNKEAPVDVKDIEEVRSSTKNDNRAASDLLKRYPFNKTLAENNGLAKDALNKDYFDPSKTTLVRTFMPGASPAAFAVALKNGPYYCWDAGECRLRYIWYEGGFIENNKKHWSSNGKPVASFKGERFYVAPSSKYKVEDFNDKNQIHRKDPVYDTLSVNDFPFRIGFKAQVRPRYLGYHWDGDIPVFRYKIGEHTVTEKIETSEGVKGIVQTFKLDGPLEAVEMPLVSSKTVKISCEEGRIYGNTLYLSPHESQSFKIVIVEK